jgi:hypothetical protein
MAPPTIITPPPRMIRGVYLEFRVPGTEGSAVPGTVYLIPRFQVLEALWMGRVWN